MINHIFYLGSVVAIKLTEQTLPIKIYFPVPNCRGYNKQGVAVQDNYSKKEGS